MANIQTKFGGLTLKNPFIVASAPPSESVDSILKCADAGAGAIVTKTMANFDASSLKMGARRSYVTKNEYWAQGTFRHETLTLNEGIKLLQTVVKNTDVPIIASVGFLSLDIEKILQTCLEVQEAGASMIHLDLFYIPQPRVSAENLNKLTKILKILKEYLKIPFGPKLNHDFPPDVAIDVLNLASPDVVFLLDSHRTPVPIDIFKQGSPKISFLENAIECSLFGEWQKPITLQYTSKMALGTAIPICAGGGLMSGNDAIEALMYGATATQFATAIIRNGYKEISRIIKQISDFVDSQGYEDLKQIIGLAFTHINSNEEEYIEAKAVVDHNLCINCGKCTKIVFCNDIKLNDQGLVKVEESCDGCGFCSALCPVSGALEIHKM